MSIEKSNVALYRIIGSVVYDWLVLLGLLMVFGFFAVAINHSLTGEEAISSENIFFKLYILAVIALYFVYFWHRSGQTVGMKAWKIQLQSVDQTPIKAKQLFTRLIVAVPSYAIGLIGILWLFTPSKRTWQDMASGTQLTFKPRK
ncbi:RDD family protein [Reinekea marina]|uniref:RDD family protein n=1 Tax=Reinekea marina TaxID=1310421 RepID=A0ABV7WML4_9GAMM